MFTGDTLFSGGILPVIAESGSIGDYINSLKSLQTRHIDEIYPGHGEVSTDPAGDITSSIYNAFALLNGDRKSEIKFLPDNRQEQNSGEGL